MKGDYTIILSEQEHDYIFSSKNEIRSAFPAIIVCKRRNNKSELGLSLIDADSGCIIYYLDSHRIIQLYRAMKILGELNVVNELTLSNCLLIAARYYSKKTGAIIDELENTGTDIQSIQTDVFSHEMTGHEFSQIMKAIKNASVDYESGELEEELKIRYIPETRFVKKMIAAG